MNPTLAVDVDGLLSGAGGPILGAVLGGVIGFAGRWFFEIRRTRREDEKERTRRADELHSAARGIGAIFDDAASAMRIASDSGGSLSGFAYNEEALSSYTDVIRRDVDSDLWTRIQNVTRSLNILASDLVKDRTLSEEKCDRFAQSFAAAADRVRETGKPSQGTSSSSQV